MAKFKAIQNLTEVVIQTYWEEFDTTDQAKWEELKNNVESEFDNDDFEALPNDAPDDPTIWFELYKKLDYREYANQDEDQWVSQYKGTTEYEYVIEDEDGNQIISEEL